MTCKNRLPYNLYCVGGDVKHCTINQSINYSFLVKFFKSLFVYLLNFIVIKRCRFYVTDNVSVVHQHEAYRRRKDFDQKFLHFCLETLGVCHCSDVSEHRFDTESTFGHASDTNGLVTINGHCTVRDFKFNIIEKYLANLCQHTLSVLA